MQCEDDQDWSKVYKKLGRECIPPGIETYTMVGEKRHGKLFQTHQEEVCSIGSASYEAGMHKSTGLIQKAFRIALIQMFDNSRGITYRPTNKQSVLTFTRRVAVGLERLMIALNKNKQIYSDRNALVRNSPKWSFNDPFKAIHFS